MKKPAVVIGVLIGFFALLLYAWWLAAILAAVGGLLIYAGHALEKENAAFQQLVLYTLRHRAGPEEGRANHQLSKANFQKSQLIRNLQIIHDCIYLTQTSKKTDVVRSRLELMEKLYRETRQEHCALMTEETQKEVFAEIGAAVRAGHTNIYANPAAASLDKAETLKTKSAIARHVAKAREIIAEGKTNPAVDHSVLDALAERADALAAHI